MKRFVHDNGRAKLLTLDGIPTDSGTPAATAVSSENPEYVYNLIGLFTHPPYETQSSYVS